jgi:hypothetical protein
MHYVGFEGSNIWTSRMLVPKLGLKGCYRSISPVPLYWSSPSLLTSSAPAFDIIHGPHHTAPPVKIGTYGIFYAGFHIVHSLHLPSLNIHFCTSWAMWKTSTMKKIRIVWCTFLQLTFLFWNYPRSTTVTHDEMASDNPNFSYSKIKDTWKVYHPYHISSIIY